MASIRAGDGFARPPQGRVQRIEIAPQRGGDRRVAGCGGWRRAAGWSVSDQQLLQQGGTGEVRRPRVVTLPGWAAKPAGPAGWWAAAAFVRGGR